MVRAEETTVGRLPQTAPPAVRGAIIWSTTRYLWRFFQARWTRWDRPAAAPARPNAEWFQRPDVNDVPWSAVA